MTAQWYLLCNDPARATAPLDKAKGQPIGPMPAEKLLELALRGDASPADWVWMDGMDVQITVERFLAIARTGKIPDSAAHFRPEWLADVARREVIERSRLKPTPGWLKEMQRGQKPTAPPTKPAPPPVTPAKQTVSPDDTTLQGLPVDWLKDIRQTEELHRARSAPTATPPVAPQPSTVKTPAQRRPSRRYRAASRLQASPTRRAATEQRQDHSASPEGLGHALAAVPGL